MNLEDTLTQTFESRLDAIEISPGDVAGARSTGRRMRVRRRVAVGVAAVAVVAVGVAGIAGAPALHARGRAVRAGPVSGASSRRRR